MVQTPSGTAVQRTEEWLAGANGGQLLARAWRPGTPASAAVIIVHGYAEHSGRYDHVGAALAASGCAVHAFDQRGHGRSDGDRALVRSIDEYLDDLDVFLARVRSRDEALPLYLLGHSMGGAIVALHAIERRPPVRGVLLSGAAAGGGEQLGWRGRILTAVGRLFPKWPLVKLDGASVSRDSEVVRLYDADPLNYRGRMKAGLLRALILGGQRIARGAASLDYPLLIMHGTDDRLVPADASQRLFETSASRDKTLKLYDGLYHEIFNEPEREDVLADVIAWLNARVETAR